MKNYLLPVLEDYYEEILSIESKLSVSKTLLEIGAEKLKEENQIDRAFFTAITSFRDISLIGAEENLYTPDYFYSVYFSTLNDEVSKIINERCCYAVSQSYEALENYLIEILSEYLFLNQEKILELKLIEIQTPLIRVEIREIIKRNQKLNNKGLIHILRKLSSHFREFELKNIYGVSITQWFDLISMIRHTLVHNRQVISPALLEYISEQKATAMFDQFFKRKQIGKNICVYIEMNTASDIINWLNTFAHFIFKSLSLSLRLSIAIEEYNPYKNR
jgi:hypothetical protein